MTPQCLTSCLSFVFFPRFLKKTFFRLRIRKVYLKNEKTDKRLFISGAVQIDDLIPSRQEGGKVHQTDKTKKKF